MVVSSLFVVFQHALLLFHFGACACGSHPLLPPRHHGDRVVLGAGGTGCAEAQGRDRDRCLTVVVVGVIDTTVLSVTTVTSIGILFTGIGIDTPSAGIAPIILSAASIGIAINHICMGIRYIGCRKAKRHGRLLPSVGGIVSRTDDIGATTSRRLASRGRRGYRRTPTRRSGSVGDPGRRHAAVPHPRLLPARATASGRLGIPSFFGRHVAVQLPPVQTSAPASDRLP